MAKGQGRSEGQGLKLLYLRDYFFKETGKDHQKDIEQIIAFLDSQNIRVSDKTLYSDFRQLREKLNVPIKYDGRTRKYYVTDPLYSGYELALLMDCVCNASFITEGDALRLLDIVKGLANVADRSMLAQRIAEYEDRRRIEASVIENLRLLTDAVERKRKVMFQKIKYVAEHTKHTEVEPYFVIASPLRIVRGSDGYELVYLVELCDLPEEEQLHLESHLRELCGDDTYKHIMTDEFSRDCDLSLLTNIRILDVPAKEPKRFGGEVDEEILRDYEERHKERAITIRFCKSKIDAIAEALGSDAILIEMDEHYFKTTVKRELDESFYGWFSYFANYAKILSPQDAVDGYLEWCRRRLLAQEVLYRYDIENSMVAMFNGRRRRSSREMRISGGAEVAKWKFDYQEIGFNSHDNMIEVHLPDHYDNTDEYDEDGNYIGDD